jgi:hypothetical protein
MRRRTGIGRPSSPPTRPPIAIRRAWEAGWTAFLAAAWPLVLFTLLLGSLNLLCQLAIRWSGELLLNPFGQPDPLAMALQLIAWLGYLLSNLWLLVGLLHGANGALQGERPRLIQLLAVPIHRPGAGGWEPGTGVSGAGPRAAPRPGQCLDAGPAPTTSGRPSPAGGAGGRDVSLHRSAVQPAHQRALADVAHSRPFAAAGPPSIPTGSRLSGSLCC